MNQEESLLIEKEEEAEEGKTVKVVIMNQHDAGAKDAIHRVERNVYRDTNYLYHPRDVATYTFGSFERNYIVFLGQSFFFFFCLVVHVILREAHSAHDVNTRQSILLNFLYLHC